MKWSKFRTHSYEFHLFLSFLDKIGLYLRARIWDLRLNWRYYLWTILREMSIFPWDSKTTRRCWCHATNWSYQNRWLKSITLQSKKDLVLLGQAQTFLSQAQTLHDLVHWHQWTFYNISSIEPTSITIVTIKPQVLVDIKTSLWDPEAQQFHLSLSLSKLQICGIKCVILTSDIQHHDVSDITDQVNICKIFRYSPI